MVDRTVQQDLQELLNYNYNHEFLDFKNYYDKGEMDFSLSQEEEAVYGQRIIAEGRAAYEDIAAKHSTHVFGCIVRLGRQLCGWEKSDGQ